MTIDRVDNSKILTCSIWVSMLTFKWNEVGKWAAARTRLLGFLTDKCKELRIIARPPSQDIRLVGPLAKSLLKNDVLERESAETERRTLAARRRKLMSEESLGLIHISDDDDDDDDEKVFRVLSRRSGVASDGGDKGKEKKKDINSPTTTKTDKKDSGCSDSAKEELDPFLEELEQDLNQLHRRKTIWDVLTTY